MKKNSKEGIKNISSRTLYLLLMLVIVVSVLGTFLITSSLDNNKINSRSGASTFDISETNTNAEIGVNILPNPYNKKGDEI